MSKTVITKEELQVPAGVITQVADLLLENEITNSIVGANIDEDFIILEVAYDKDERETIHEIKDIIADYEETQEEEDE